jgi:8-oxo-dGTP pyrophosphatase MutT (NUDIX family)
MEGGETPLEGMRRELREETGLTPQPDELTFFKTWYVRGPDRDLVFHVFRLELPVEPEVVLNDYDHQAFRWATLEEALKMDLIHDNGETIKLVFGMK